MFSSTLSPTVRVPRPVSRVLLSILSLLVVIVSGNAWATEEGKAKCAEFASETDVDRLAKNYYQFRHIQWKVNSENASDQEVEAWEKMGHKLGNYLESASEVLAEMQKKIFVSSVRHSIYLPVFDMISFDNVMKEQVLGGEKTWDAQSWFQECHLSFIYQGFTEAQIRGFEKQRQLSQCRAEVLYNQKMDEHTNRRANPMSKENRRYAETGKLAQKRNVRGTLKDFDPYVKWTDSITNGFSAYTIMRTTQEGDLVLLNHSPDEEAKGDRFKEDREAKSESDRVDWLKEMKRLCSKEEKAVNDADLYSTAPLRKGQGLSLDEVHDLLLKIVNEERR